ncbi:uncharacterized protein LOC143664558 isoform X2 [Tamandua tetradactyla]|uniref:uncharacterized protein LOC143664558 isoform X2 n=1 Tax=Tamandua tetradactyla TaxID=48850 RepID=UPI0040548446
MLHQPYEEVHLETHLSKLFISTGISLQLEEMVDSRDKAEESKDSVCQQMEKKATAILRFLLYAHRVGSEQQHTPLYPKQPLHTP